MQSTSKKMEADFDFSIPTFVVVVSGVKEMFRQVKRKDHCYYLVSNLLYFDDLYQD